RRARYRPTALQALPRPSTTASQPAMIGSARPVMDVRLPGSRAQVSTMPRGLATNRFHYSRSEARLQIMSLDTSAFSRRDGAAPEPGAEPDRAALSEATAPDRGCLPPASRHNLGSRRPAPA